MIWLVALFSFCYYRDKWIIFIPTKPQKERKKIYRMVAFFGTFQMSQCKNVKNQLCYQKNKFIGCDLDFEK